MSLTFRVPAQTGTITGLDRADINQTTIAAFNIPLTSFRIHDAFNTNLPGTSSGNDLGLVGGTFGTASPVLQTADLKAAGATSNYARALFQLPAEYDAGETIIIRVHTQMVTTVSDTTSTIDVECYKVDQAGGIGSDLCATAATTNNSLTDADIDFTITATGLAAGDVFDLRITSAVNDAATGTAVIAEIGNVDLRCDIRA